MITTARKEQRIIRASPLGLLSFLLGVTIDIKFDLIGELYLVEPTLVLVTFLLLLTKGSGGAFRAPIFWGFIFSAIVTLAGYIISDLFVGSVPAQYLRGWGQIGLLIGSCASLMILTAHDRQNLWWFMFGTAIGGIAYLAIQGVPIHTWKLGYGERATILILTLAPILPTRVTALVLVAFGGLNMILDYRNVGAASIAVAAILWYRSGRARKPTLSFTQYVKLLLVMVVGMGSILLATRWTEGEYAARRDASNSGRSAGITVALRAIADSPLIGYGSWTVNDKLADMVRREIEETRDRSLPRVAPIGSGSGFDSHSQILQSWVQGGILGTAFFLLYGYQLVLAIHWYALRRPLDFFSAAFIFTLIIGLWNWIASPFHGNQRIQIAITVAIIAAKTYDQYKASRLSQTTVTAVSSKALQKSPFVQGKRGKSNA